MEATTESIAVAAIVHQGKGQADATLLEFVQQLQAQGHTVRGLLPGPQADPSDCTTRTVRDIATGTLYPISQNLGKASQACCLDTSALVRCAVVLRNALEQGADLVVINRFGILEADGQGFSAEFLELISSGQPVLTVVSLPYLDAWREFTGGLATELPLNVQALHDWFNSIQQASSSPTALNAQ